MAGSRSRSTHRGPATALVASTLLLGMVAGCNRHWTKVGVESVQVEKDFYACMKENTNYEESSSVDRNGARSSKGMRVNQKLADACMRAKGYTLERPNRAPGAPKEPVEPQSRLEMSVGAVGGLGLGSEFVHVYPYDTDAQQFEPVQTTLRTRSGAVGGVDAGIHYRIAPVVDASVTLGGRMVPRSARGVLAVPFDLDNGSNFYGSGGGSSALSLSTGIDVRLRFPAWKRLYALGGARGQTLPGGGANSGVASIKLYDPDTEVFTEFDQEVQGPTARGGLAVLGRAGLGLDVLYAAPHGFRTECAVELLLTNSIVRGSYSPAGDTLGMTCSASWVFALGKQAK